MVPPAKTTLRRWRTWSGARPAPRRRRNAHRDDREVRDAVRALRKAILALEKAAKDAHQHNLTADLLELGG